MKKTRLLIAMFLMASIFAVSAFATITINFDVEETSTDTGMDCYKVVVTQSDDEGDWRALQTKISFNYDKIIPIDWYEGIVPSYSGEEAEYPFVFNEFKNSRNGKAELQRPQVPVWTIAGADSEVIVELYWSAFTSYPIRPDETMIYEMYFKLADGVALEDLTHNDFDVYYVKYANGVDNFYGNSDESKNNVVLANNVVPEAPVEQPITISVLAGDKVYLQNGTVETMAAANEAYELPKEVGYVAVNTGKTAQKTYYVDGTTATEVHTNAVLGSDTVDLREHKSATTNGQVIEDSNGLRFQMTASTSSRKVAAPHDVVEAGFLMTVKSNKVTTALGGNFNLTHDMVAGGFVKKGEAYNTATGLDKKMDSSSDVVVDIRGVFYNIPITKSGVKTVVVSRPYYKVGETYIYGETTEACLYDIAKAIKDGGYAGCTDSMKAYVDEIVTLVDGVETPVVEDEVIIDVGGLYTAQ